MKKTPTHKLKIVITGANGQLGKCLQDIAGLFCNNYLFYFKSSKELDITNVREVDKFFTQQKFDFCINCAAYTSVDKAESDKVMAYLVNSTGVRNIANTCKANNTTLIHISTDFVFDGKSNNPYSELDLPRPINVYGASKLEGERHIERILKNYFIIRTSWLYSEYGDNFVKTMLRLGEEKDEISVVNDQIGSPTYAGDLGNAIMKIIITKTEKFGLYHYSNKGEISWFDFASMIFEINKMNVELKAIPSSAYPTPAKRPAYSCLENSKIEDILGSDGINDWKSSLLKNV